MKTIGYRAAMMTAGTLTRVDGASALESYMALRFPGRSLKGCKFDENLVPGDLNGNSGDLPF